MKIINHINQSIRLKLTIMFQFIFLALLLMVALLDTFFLEDFYIKDRLRLLNNAYTALDSLTKDDTSREALESYIRGLSENYGISVIIFDTRNDTSISFSGDTEYQTSRLNRHIFGKTAGTEEKVLENHDNYRIDYVKIESLESQYIESWGYFSDNYTSFIMSITLESLKNPLRLFNRFLFMIGFFILIAGTVAIYIFSKKITKPINDLAELSGKIKELDFSKRYEGNDTDEIGVLGKSMNALSEKLEENIACLKTANNNLKQDMENKEKLMEKQLEFTANVSHELKTPIALIQGYSEGLCDLCEDEESRKYYAGVILDEAVRMNNIIKSLMSLSSLEQGMILPDFKRFDIKALAEKCLQRSGKLFEGKFPIEPSLENEIAETYVWGDESKIEEALTNYINNAFYHLKEPFVISLYSEKRGNLIRIHVYNTGERIPEESIQRIWEKFYKTDKAHTASHGGAGLGLSIVKAIMDSHGREYGVKNMTDGVDFWIELEI